MKEKIKKLAWPLFAAIAFILWTVDYYLVYFGLSFFFYKLTVGGSVIRIVLVLLAIPIAFFVIKIFYGTTFFTAYLALKNKVIYFLIATLYSLNRIASVFQYCSVKSPTIPNSIIVEIPCYANLFITFAQIILIFILGYVVLKIAREDKND